jgi:hypothetical protein
LVKEGDGSIWAAANQNVVRATWKIGRGNLAISRRRMTTALEVVLWEHQPRWKLTDAEKIDFLTTLCRRIRNLNRVVTQGLLRTPRAPWAEALKLPAFDDSEEDEVESEIKQPIEDSCADEASAGAEAVGGVAIVAVIAKRDVEIQPVVEFLASA